MSNQNQEGKESWEERYKNLPQTGMTTEEFIESEINHAKREDRKKILDYIILARQADNSTAAIVANLIADLSSISDK